MDVSRRRAGAKSGVVAGSVWESRMKSDEVKGGIKVFNGEESNNLDNQINGGDDKKIIMKKSPTGNLVAVSGKRKTWKSESFDGPIQIGKVKNVDQECKELSVSVDGGLKRNSVTKKGRSEKEMSSSLSLSVDGGKKGSPIQNKKTRSESGISAESRKSKSESLNGVEHEKINNSVVQLRKAKSEPAKSEPNKDLEISCKETTPDDKSSQQNEEFNFPVDIEKLGSEETCKELDVVCQDKTIPISSNVTNVSSGTKSPPQLDIDEEVDGDDQDFDEEEEQVADEEEFEEVEAEVEVEIEKKSIETKDIHLPPQIVVNQFNNKAPPFSSSVNKEPPPVIKRATIYSGFAKPSTSSVSGDEYQSFPQTHNKLQNLVDLVMWRDVSKSAFVFGIGTFIIISSSYTTDLNISFISVISYLGLVYLAVIFLYRAIICRGYIDIDDTNYVLGEEEAIWLLKLFLPYLNEFLLKLKALFSGDPATTMKLAVLLFVLARCGNSITIWKMAKLGFFGVFIIPRVCSSYSTQLTAYGKFWIRRFRDAWDSCSHKKAVAGAIFTLVWNLSSVVARIWAVFVLFVAIRYYQQSMVRDEWVEDDTVAAEETKHEPQIGAQREGFRPNKEAQKPNTEGPRPLREWRRPTLGQANKAKKAS